MAASAKQTFLDTYDKEHATTMRVLRAFPEDQLDMKPSEKSNSARHLAWVFVLERYLGKRIWNDEFAQGLTPGNPPKQPEKWSDMLDALDQAHHEFRDLIASASDEDLHATVHFFTAPKTMGEMSRLDMIWFLLHDQIHHRGQFSVYLRIAGAKVPSIYGPSADEPWM
jgi:uncharacterized damage-inducible protein DinB